MNQSNWRVFRYPGISLYELNRLWIDREWSIRASTAKSQISEILEHQWNYNELGSSGEIDTSDKFAHGWNKWF